MTSSRTGSDVHEGPSAAGSMTLLTLTTMVVGSMVGAGVFSLPSRFAQETGVAGAAGPDRVRGGTNRWRTSCATGSCPRVRQQVRDTYPFSPTGSTSRSRRTREILSPQAAQLSSKPTSPSPSYSTAKTRSS